MIDALKRLTASSKALVMLGLTVLVFFGVFKGKLTWEQAEHFLAYTAPAWLIAVGLEDAAKKHGAASVEAAKLSMRPPPPPATTETKSDAS
jgi:ABC-type anion transport system duplicated permease subunit